MHKSTLLRFAYANPIALLFFILFVNFSHAQSIINTTNCVGFSEEYKCLHCEKGDRNIDCLTRQETSLIVKENCDNISFNEFVGIVNEDKELTNKFNFDTILFVQYYKQFFIFYKNIS